MARRNLTGSSFRDVTNVVAETVKTPDVGTDLLDQATGFAKGILEQNEQAKVTENFSKLQLDLGQLDLEYKNEYASNPQEGYKKFKQERQKLVEQYGKNISPLYRGNWNTSVKDFVVKNDAVQEKWVYSQTRKNSIKFVNNSIENSINQAMKDGLIAGESSEDDVDAFINFAGSFQNLEKYAVDNLGEGQAEDLLKDFEQDYMKAFVSGVGVKNPSRALSLLDDDQFKSAFDNPQQYVSMRRSFEIKSERAKRAATTKAKTRSMSDTNKIGTNLQDMNYAQLQQTFEFTGASPEAQAFYMDISGYTKQKKRLSAPEKAELKNKFYLTLNDFVQNDKVSIKDMELLQDAVYGGMRKKALNETEGFGLLNSLMEPLLEEQRQMASKFESGEWNPFQDNLGLDSLNAEIEKISATSMMGKYKTGDRAGVIKSPEDLFNTRKNANLMYDVYLQSLDQEAKQRGTTITGLGKLGRAEEVKVYNKALNNAKQALMGVNFPNAPEGVNTVIQPIAPPILDVDIDNMTKEQLDAFEAQLDLLAQ